MNYEKEINYIYSKLNEMIKRVNQPQLEGNIIVQFDFLKGAVANFQRRIQGTTQGTISYWFLRFDIRFYKKHIEDRDEIDATIAHEFAHILQRVMFPKVSKMKPHGKEFKVAMMLLGYNVKGADRYSEQHRAARKKI